MRVLVVVVGKARGAVSELIGEYEARAGRYWKLEVVEVKSGRSGGGPDGVRADEAARLLARIPAELEVVALTRSGKEMSSEDLADHLQGHAVRSSAGVAFVVGGAFGLDPSVLARARVRLSLSSLTFTHEMARLLLAEQLYRAGTILRGEPYHKG